MGLLTPLGLVAVPCGSAAAFLVLLAGLVAWQRDRLSRASILGRGVRAATTWRLAGVVLGVVGAWAAIRAEQENVLLGRGLMIASPLAALGLLIGVVIGEWLITAPEGRVRTARLEIRRPVDYLPGGLTSLVAGVLATLGGVLTIAVLTGASDDRGRPGRALATTCIDPRSGELVRSMMTPWPGIFYALPLGIVVLVGVGVGGISLLQVARRPPHPGTRAADDAQRRSSAAAVVAGLGLLSGLPLAGVASTAAAAILNQPCTSGFWEVTVPVFGLAALAGLMVAGWSTAVLLQPSRPPAQVTAPLALR